MQSDRFVLITKRLMLRPLSLEDAPDFADLGSDPEVVKTLVHDWSTSEKRIEVAKCWIGGGQSWDEQGYGVWGCFDVQGLFGEKGRLIGICAAAEELPEVGCGPEIYYAFCREVWGRGVGTETVRAVVDYLFRGAGAEAVEALIFAELNAASVKLVEKLGMRLVGRYPIVDYLGEAETRRTICYELWRVENSSLDIARDNLAAAAFKIGQFVAEGAEPQGAMEAALLEAATVSGLVERVGKKAVGEVINDCLSAGISAKGFAHYRVVKVDYVALKGAVP